MTKNIIATRLRRSRYHDYTSPVPYFVTIRWLTVQDPLCAILLERGRDHSELSRVGRLVEQTWKEIPTRFSGTYLDCHAIMPDHFHGILVPNGSVTRFPYSLSTIMGWFKQRSSSRINAFLGTRGCRRWQTGYYERVVRNEKEAIKFQRYILTNVLRELI